MNILIQRFQLPAFIRLIQNVSLIPFCVKRGTTKKKKHTKNIEELIYYLKLL